jgi:hypothetical protein
MTALATDEGDIVIPDSSVSQDIEPEYITVSADGTRSYVTLQEVNAIAVIDLTDPSADRPIYILPAGAVDSACRATRPTSPIATGRAARRRSDVIARPVRKAFRGFARQVVVANKAPSPAWPAKALLCGGMLVVGQSTT